MEQATDIFWTLIGQHSPALLASVALLTLSATFSGFETALFSLSAPALNRLRASAAKMDRIITSLHDALKNLLPTILFCNMAVNVLIYSLSASIANDLGAKHGGGGALAYSVASLIVVVFFGEVFPKQLAISSSLLVARLTSLQVWVCYRTLAKPMRILNAIVQACERVVDNRRPEVLQGLREEELRLLVEMSKNDGAISEGEYELIDGVVELPEVRIRDIMIPRVDVRSLPAGCSLADAVRTARRSKHCKLPVFDDADDDFAGWADTRDFYGESDGNGETVESYMREFRFFSEHDRADQVLEAVKHDGGELYAVVDERGVIVGFFTLQDIMDEVLGHFGEHGAAPPSEIREDRGAYIISGRLSVREWRDLFSVSSGVPRSATVGGLVVSLLGRMPRPGDRVVLDNMEMTVLSTWHNRVREVALRLVGDDAAAKEKRISTRLPARNGDDRTAGEDKP